MYFIHDGREYQVKFSEDNAMHAFYPRGNRNKPKRFYSVKETTAALLNVIHSNMKFLLLMETVICSPWDTFSHKEGRKQAIKRLGERLPRTLRNAMLQAYFQRKPKNGSTGGHSNGGGNAAEISKKHGLEHYKRGLKSGNVFFGWKEITFDAETAEKDIQATLLRVAGGKKR